MFRNHAALTADSQSLTLFIEDTNDAEVEFKLICKDFENFVEYGLQIIAAGNGVGCFVEHTQLLATGRSADVDRAEQVKHIFHVTAPCREVFVDYNARWCGSDGAGQG